MPRLPSTLPKRTDDEGAAAAPCAPATRSARRCASMRPSRSSATPPCRSRSAPAARRRSRCASATTLRVPMTLLVTASSGFSSISGTCLCAAAWKTTAGRMLIEHERQSARDREYRRSRRAPAPAENRRAASPRLRKCCSRRARAGPGATATHCAICRASSEPIDPPAPVTSTTRPRDELECRWPCSPGCAATGRQISTLRRRLTPTLPVEQLEHAGHGLRFHARPRGTD